MNTIHRFLHWLRLQSRTLLIVLASVAVLLLVVRMVLPSVLKHAINKRLSEVEGYSGRVHDIDLHLWRGAYEIDGVVIVKTSGKTEEPFFSAEVIDFSIAWRELFRGRIVSDIKVQDGVINFVNGPSADSSQLEADRRWQEVIEDIFPIEIAHCEIDGGSIRFIDNEADPRVDVFVNNLEVQAVGLRNRPADDEDPFPAKISVSGSTLGDGQLTIFARAEPLAEQPHFELKLEVNDVDLPALNDFLRAYGNVDVSRGLFDLYVEVGAKDGRFEGYVKPFFEDMDFSNTSDKRDKIGKRLWETLVSGIARVLKNRRSDQVATRIPFSGEFGSTEVGVWATITNLLRNGLVRALTEGVEGTVKAEDAVTPKPEHADPKTQAKRKD